MWWPFNKKPLKHDTPLGVFERLGRSNSAKWQLYYRMNSTLSFTIYALDANGAPSPSFLANLVTIIENLEETEQQIRKRFSEISNAHELTSLREEPDADYVLSFANDDDEGNGESVFFKIVNGEATLDAIVD